MYTLTQFDTWFNVCTVRKFETLQRAKQWASQCGILSPERIKITDSTGALVYGYREV